MGYKKGVDRTQRVMFPEAVDDYVSEDNSVRFLDAFVDSLDMVGLKFRQAIPSDKGAPAYDPRVLLKLFIYGYQNQIRSSRRLETETKRNLELMWLMGRLSPDHKTISDFRKDHPAQLKGVTKEFIKVCRELKLIGSEVVGIDGSKFAAVNGNQSNYTQKRLRRELAAVEEEIALYMQLMDANDHGEEAQARRPSAEELKAKIELLEANKGRFEALQKQMEDLGETQVSTTDPESRLMNVQGRFDVCYNAQIAVDSKHHLIVAHDVTNAPNDQEQLGAMAIAAKEELEVETLKVVADGGYYSEEQLAQCEAAGIETYLPQPAAKAGVYPKSLFTYLPAEDAYRCPAGALLTYRHTERKHGKEQRCYQTSACGTCPLRGSCTKDEDGRRIRRSELEWAMERVVERVTADPQILRKRKTLVEHPFGTMKRAKGEGYFLTRGLRKVRGEFSLSVLAYNLRRVLKLVPMSDLMALLRARKGSPGPFSPLNAPSAFAIGVFRVA
jgi:transposase